MLNKRNLENLLPNINCVECGENYTRESVCIVRKEDGLMVLKVKCKFCMKSFAMAYLGLDINEIEESLEILNDDIFNKLNPINYDDVLDAHCYCQNLEDNWYSFIKDKKINNI